MSIIMDKERSLIIITLKSQKNNLLEIWNKYIPTNSKDSNASVEIRKKGNNQYLQKNHDDQVHRDIFTFYCKSIALAPSESKELALAYGNRSAFLLHINQYQDCIKDIDKALGITNSNALKVKLLHRKIECLNNLGFCDNQNFLVHSVGDDNDRDKEVVELISKLETYSFESKDLKQKQQDDKKTVKETENVQDFVTMRNDKIYGRHLVAAKDYKPGDIIIVEKFAASSVNPIMTHIVCHYCYKYCWSNIPCDKCSWVMFCSEHCREKAWEAYHDIECDLISFLNAFNSSWNNFGICIRTLIMAIKEAGGLVELRAELQSMVQCSDKKIEKFFTNKSFMKNSVKSVFFLKSVGVSEFLQKTVSKALVIPLIGLVKYTPLIKNFDFEKCKDLSSNDDIVFLGSLLQKLAMIKIVNSYMFSDEHLKICNYSKSMVECRQHSCCNKGVCFLPLTSLINHSCVPNVGKCFAGEHKLVIYALQPIKKNAQIFISYICNFYDAPASYRRELLKQYNFLCKCKACKESWPTLNEIESCSQSNLDECQSIFDALNSGKTYFNRKQIKLLSDKITQTLKSLKQPCYETCLMDQAMNDIFARMYLVPQLSFGKCKKSL